MDTIVNFDEFRKKCAYYLFFDKRDRHNRGIAFEACRHPDHPRKDIRLDRGYYPFCEESNCIMLKFLKELQAQKV